MQRLVTLPVVPREIATTLFSATAALSPGPRRPRASCAPAVEAAPVRIEQDLLAVEADALAGRTARRHVRVDLARREAADERVPVVVGPIAFRIEHDAARVNVVGAIEQQQLDALASFANRLKFTPSFDSVAPRGKLPSFVSSGEARPGLRRWRLRQNTPPVPGAVGGGEHQREIPPAFVADDGDPLKASPYPT